MSGYIAVCLVFASALLGRAEEPAGKVVSASGAALSFGEMPITIHVSPAGDDAASGGPEAPVLRVQQAVNVAMTLADQGKDVRVIIRPGVYREQIVLRKNSGVGAGVVSIEASPSGCVKISGSEAMEGGWNRFHVEWENWKWSGSDGRFHDARLFRHAWPYVWAPAQNPWADSEILLDPEVQRTEMIFLNGVPLRQVMSFGELREGTFHINSDVRNIYLWPPAGVDPQHALIEVAVRTNLLETGGRNNVVVRGLTFCHARGTTGGSALLINGSRNIRVENCRFAWNGWNGASCAHSENLSYRDCVFERNGIGGMGAYRSRNILIEDCVDACNNWRGRAGGFVNWANGSKFLSTRGVTFRRHTAVSNETYGLWIDYDNRDILIEQSTMTDNLLAGVFLEANQGPIMVRESMFSRNQSGVMDGRSDQVTMVGCRVTNNREGQLLFSGDPRGRDITEFDSGRELHSGSRGWTISGNTIETVTAGSCLVQFARHLPDQECKNIIQAMGALNNHYAAPEAAVFVVRDRNVDFATWQNDYSIDRRSVFRKISKQAECPPVGMP